MGPTGRAKNMLRKNLHIVSKSVTQHNSLVFIKRIEFLLFRVRPIQDRMCLLITISCYKGIPFDFIYKETNWEMCLFIFAAAPGIFDGLPTYPGGDQATRSSKIPMSE